MKTLFHATTQVLLVLMVLLIGALFDFALGAIVPGGIAYASLTGLLVKAFSDPQTKQDWERLAFQLGQEKTEFNEAEIGTQFTADGPKPSQLTSAPPILYYNAESSGRKVNVRYHQPLKEGVSEVMNAGRYAGQVRAGKEEKMSVQHVVGIVDLFHLGVREDEVEQGEQFTANMALGDVVSAFVEKMTDYHAKRNDYGLFYGFFARYDLHSFTNACLSQNVSHGAKPVADINGGLLSPPREHPNIFVWHKTSNVFHLEKVAYNETAATHSNNISTAASKITPAALPNLSLLYFINNVCESSNIIPCQLRMADGKLKKYWKVYMPRRMKYLLEQDPQVFKLYNSAHQGIVDKNPLLQQSDLLFKSLIIRESSVLEQPEFTYKYNFNVDGGTDSDDASFAISGGTAQEGNVGIEFAERGFASSSAADGVSGFDTDQVGRVMVLGANAILKISGKTFDLNPMEVSDYGKNAGLGQTHFYGNQLVVRRKVGSSGLEEPTAPQSFQVLAYMGEGLSTAAS